MKRRATADPVRHQERTPESEPQVATGRPGKTWLRLREMHGHVTVTPETMTAWFVLGQQRWSFTTERQREALIVEYGRRLAALAGYTVHLRVTNRPYPASTWAQALHANTPAPLGGRSGPAWGKHLVDTQRALQSSTLSDKEVFLGIDLAPRKRSARTKATLRGMSGARAEIDAQGGTLRRLADIVAGPGMNGRPARVEEIEWLVHRSIRLGLPALAPVTPESDEPWLGEDMATFTDGVEYAYKPFGATVEVSADYNGHVETRHVAVMAVGRMGPLTVPQTTRDPWMQHTDRLSFPVEWASTFKVLTGPEAAKETGRKRLAIRDQQKHWREHGLEEPLDLQRKAEHARRIEDETVEGDPVTAARCYGWHRIAVSAATEEECLKRVQEVKDTYQGQQVTIQHPRAITDAAAQLPLLTEFVPGQPVSTTAYMRRLPALYMAAGLPHVSATVGDRRGPHMGHTCGTSKRAFMFDPHYAMEVQETAGLMPVVGGLGSGKSGLIGKMVYEEVMRGITTTVLDPSGPLANLCAMDDLRDHARHIDLVNGQDGILSPWSVVGDPVRENYDNEERYREALVYAFQGRKMLAMDVARMLLPAQVDEMAETPLMLSDAVRAVGGARDKSLWDIVEALEQRSDGNQHARNLANFLRDMADMPQSRLFFPNTVREQETPTDTLLVLTMNGLQLPSEDQPRKTWSTSEQVAVPLLHLASHFATARAYGLGRHERKMVALDEAGMVGRWGSGRALFTNLGRDTRKWNIAAPIASQNPGDILGLNVANFISAAFVGRIEDADIAAEALRLLRITENAGYEGVLAGLSPQVAIGNDRMRRGAREFIVKDVMGNVEKVRIDMSHQQALLDALNTTASPDLTVREDEGVLA